MGRRTARPGSTLALESKRRDASNWKGWIDITVPVHTKLVHWPGDPAVSIERVSDMHRGAMNNLSRISVGSHSGTHVDAPRHFMINGRDIGRMPLDQMIGIASVIEIEHPRYIIPEELLKHNIRRGDRVLFRTRNSSSTWHKEEFNENFVSISSEAADFLAKKKPRVVGIDYLSVGGFRDDGAYIHRTLLGNGIWLIEGLDLSEVAPGQYHLVCLPLKLALGDGAPARAILRPVRETLSRCRQA